MKLLDKIAHESQAKGRRARPQETREANAARAKSAAVAVFLASYQVCAHAEPGVAGPAFKFRKTEQTVLAICSGPQEIAQVIAQNLELLPGDFVDVVQQRQLQPTLKVFQGK